MNKCNQISSGFHIQIVFGTAFTFLIGGVFLSGFAMYMGASDLLVSYISMITNICGVSILLFSCIIGRFRSFKKITVMTVNSPLPNYYALWPIGTAELYGYYRP